jgi:PAS domain-containing protein
MRSAQQSRLQLLYHTSPIQNGFSNGSTQHFSHHNPSKPLHQQNNNHQHDPLIYSGVYAPSGFNIMDILIRIYTRPNPQIPLGSIDHSVALTLCDASYPSLPIIYCSDPFLSLTHYTSSEVIGRNCRFLQHPPKETKLRISIEDFKANEKARAELRAKMEKGEEACVKLVNFTKEGGRFENVLTVIPLVWEGGRRVVVGFQADAGKIYTS